MSARQVDLDRTRPAPGPNPAWVTSLLRRLFWVPSSPVNLAVLRIVVFGALAVVVHAQRVEAFGRLPGSLVDPPALLGEIVATLPRAPAVLAVAQWLLVASCIAAAVGWRTRASAATAAMLSVYVLGVPQLFGKVDHYHHLVWLAALLACAPCADALALDSRNAPRPPASARYGFPLRIAWVLIGFCYLFPGLAKLSEWNVWLSSDNMRGLLQVQQWAAGGGAPVPGWALVPAAAGTIVFEIGFVFAVFSRRLRPWALLCGVAFHLATFATMHILFWSLWVCYVAFIDWSRFDPRSNGAAVHEPTRTSKVAGAALVFGALVTGLSLTTAAWPFACYPTFVGRFAGSDRVVTTEVVAIRNGTSRPVQVLDWLPASRRSAVVWNALDHPAALARLGRDAAPGAEVVQVWRVVESTRPESRGTELHRALLLEVGDER